MSDRARRSFYFFLFLTLSVLVFVLNSKPVRHGDGHEYSLISKAFFEHLSPDIRISDVVGRERQLNSYSSVGFNPEIFNLVENTISANAPEAHGIFRSLDGHFYGYHFWLYPAYVAAVEAVFVLFGVNPFSGFQIANGILLIGVGYYSLVVFKSNFSRQISLVVSFVCGGGIFYLKWTHPEFFIASLLFIGFVALYRRSFKIALSCYALAAMQVVTLWTVFASVPLLIFLQNRKLFSKEILYLGSRWWVWICCLLPASSLMFYYVNFGKISLIGAGYTNLELISFSHLYSIWFDLDQGVFVGVPWLLCFIILFGFSFRSISRDCRINFFVALASSLLICIPLMAQTSVNSGQSVFQRYALYTVSPLVAWAGYYFTEVVKIKWLQIVLMTGAILYVCAFSGANADEDYFRHKPWTRVALKVIPDYYNPEPGIFYARTSGSQEWDMQLRKAMAYKDDAGVIRKILVPMEYVESALSELCSGELRDRDGAPIDLSRISHRAYGWGYLNGEMHCTGIEDGQSLNLNPRYEASPLSGIDFRLIGFPNFVEHLSGLSVYETWGRWTEGSSVVLKMKTNLPNKFKIKLKVGAFATNVGKPVKVTINDVTETFVPVVGEPREYVVDFNFPEVVRNPLVKIYPPIPISPMSLSISNDTRMLGLSIIKISFEY